MLPLVRLPRRLGLLAVVALGLASVGLAIVMNPVAVSDPTPATAGVFGTPRYYHKIWGDSFYDTVGPDGSILFTSDDSRGVNRSCPPGGSDISILRASGSGPGDLRISTVNCMTSFGPGGGGNAPDGCSWKNGGITRIGRVVYLAIARQLRGCSIGLESNGLQPSYDASIIKSSDGGRTWTNPWGTTSSDGAAPPWNATSHHYQAMFPGRRFTVPFFIQYGPGNTHTADGANKYLYTVSTDGYAYNANFLQLARVPLNKILQRNAWQFYHGPIGGTGHHWTRSPVGATHILQATQQLSQPAIQYLPTQHRYLLTTFYWTHAHPNFPNRSETPYSRFTFYTAPKPWGPWQQIFNHTTQRNLWCPTTPCHLTQQPDTTTITVGTPTDHLGLFDPTLIQKFLFTHPLTQQAILTDGDWKNRFHYPPENLHLLHVIPLNLAALLHRSSSARAARAG
jgi:hypothetical protein